MNRKEFFTKSCQCGLASFAGIILTADKSFFELNDSADQDDSGKLKYQLDFSRQRFTDLLKHLEIYLEKDKRLKLYQKIGESCASSYGEEIGKFRGNLKGILDEQSNQAWLNDYEFDEEKGEIKLNGNPRDSCGCPLVKKGLTPVEFCTCSTGHIRRIYEIVTGKNVEVRLVSSFLMGDDHCSFEIKII